MSAAFSDDDKEIETAAVQPFIYQEANSERSDKDNNSDDAGAFTIGGSISEKTALATGFGFGTSAQTAGGRTPQIVDRSAIVLRNYNGKFDAARATEFFARNFNSTTSEGICAKAVREGCAAGGIVFSDDHPVEAKGYAGFLPSQGFVAVAGGSGGRFNPSQGEYHGVAGDMVVLDAHDGGAGHIAMLGTDGIWHSDFAQVGRSGMMGGPMFFNPNATFKVFRHRSLLDAANVSADQRIGVDGKPVESPSAPATTSAAASTATTTAPAGKDPGSLRLATAATDAPAPATPTASVNITPLVTPAPTPQHPPQQSPQHGPSAGVSHI